VQRAVDHAGRPYRRTLRWPEPPARSTDPTIHTALGLLAALVLVLATGFFVAVEFALVAVDRTRVDADAAAGRRGARATAGALRRLSFHLSGAQLGITVTSLVVGFIAEPTVAAALEPLVRHVVPERSAHGVAVGAALVLATLVSMVVGELVPKSIAIAKPRAVAYAVATPAVLIDRLLGPVIAVLNGAANWTVRRFGIEPREELTSVRSLEELELLIRSSGEEGTLEPDALTMLTRAIRFGNKDAASALVPRRAVEVVHSEDTVAALAELAVATGHSRFPVVGADLDDVEGVVHVKDVYRIPYAERATTSVGELMAPPFVVPETRALGDLLVDLRDKGSHLAIVVDEHGGTAGIITLEDILEELVGEIDDEHDRPTPRLTALVRPGTWRVDGSLHADEVFDTCGFVVPEGEYETLAGFVLDRLGHLPEPGEAFEHEGWTVTVLELDGRRVAAVELRRGPSSPPAGER
jgi:CBS domain containing-hemolysin-like protein